MAAFGLALIALGVWFIVSAVANWDWFYGILEFSLVEALFGENVGRIACLIYGIALIIAGVLAWLAAG